ncbi:MFS general substrate transporter [Serendipita vermifera]|nr:MFS general substrate transporter [Serendipita vermifera]
MIISYIIRKIREANAPSHPPTAQPGYHGQQYEHQPGYPPTYNDPEYSHNYPPNVTHENPPVSTWERWLPRIKLVGAVILPVILETLDYTVVATSQTNIASVFNRLDLQSYIGTAYVLGSTVFLPIFATLADVFGRYMAMQLSMVIFLIGSALSTGAANMPMLLVGRGISGIGAAGLLSIVRVILADSANIDDNNIQGALMVLMYAIGYVLGPILGGVLLRTSWRWVFGINLPVAAVSMIIMHLLLPSITKGPQPSQRLKRLPPAVSDSFRHEVEPKSGFLGSLSRIDFIGAFLFVACGILILLGLNWGSTESWDDIKVIVCLAVGGALLLIFIVWEYVVDHSLDHLLYVHLNRRDVEYAQQGYSAQQKLGLRSRFARFSPAFTHFTDPMVPMNMFRSYDIVATNFASMCGGMVMLGIFYFVAIFYVIVNGQDAVNAGVQLLYFAPGIGIGAVVAIQLIKRIPQPKWPIIIGGILLPIGTGLLGQALYNDPGKVKGYLILTGVGVGITFGPLSYQARYSQPEERVAVVVATNLFFRTAGGTIGLAQLFAVMYSRVRHYIADQIASGRISLQDAAEISRSLSTIDVRSGGILGLSGVLKDVINEAFKDGLRWAFFSLLPWLGIAAILSFFLHTIDEDRLRGRPKPAEAHHVHEESGHALGKEKASSGETHVRHA